MKGIRDTKPNRQSKVSIYIISNTGPTTLAVISGNICDKVVSMLSTLSTIMSFKVPELIPVISPNGISNNLFEISFRISLKD